MLGHGGVVVVQANQGLPSEGVLGLNHELERIDEAHRLLDAATHIKLVPENAVVWVQDLHIEEALTPVHLAQPEPHAVEWIDNVGGRERALVVESGTVGVAVGDVPMLTARHEGRVRDGQLAILIEVIAGRRIEVIAKDAIHVGLRVGQVLVRIGVEVAHEGRSPAFAIAIHLSIAVGRAGAVHDLGAIVPELHLELSRRPVHLDADHAPVVLVAVFLTTQGVWAVIPIDAHHQVVNAIRNACHIDPLAGQPRPVDVAAMR